MVNLNRDEEEHNSVSRQLVASVIFAMSFAGLVLLLLADWIPYNSIWAVASFFGFQALCFFIVTGNFQRGDSND